MLLNLAYHYLISGKTFSTTEPYVSKWRPYKYILKSHFWNDQISSIMTGCAFLPANKICLQRYLVRKYNRRLPFFCVIGFETTGILKVNVAQNRV